MLQQREENIVKNRDKNRRERESMRGMITMLTSKTGCLTDKENVKTLDFCSCCKPE